MNVSEHILLRSGSPLHYWLHEGDTTTPLLVFTHGAGADHRMWDQQVAALGGQYRLLTWDVRGHGASRPIGDAFSLPIVVDDLLAILDHQDIDQAIFIGQSMGGNVSQELVRSYPNRVTALALVDCACNNYPLSVFERWVLSITPALLRLYPYEMLLKQSAAASAIQPAVRDYLYHAMKQLSKADIVTVLTETTRVLRDDPDYRISRPFLLLRGEHDNAGAIKRQAEAWAARETNCRAYIVLPGVGHCSNQDNPQAFNEQLLLFMTTLTTPS
jgi:3-oxoadipate enol-lactonase